MNSGLIYFKLYYGIIQIQLLASGSYPVEGVMTVLHTINMAFLFISFVLQIVFFWAIARKRKIKAPKMPLEAFAMVGLMIVFVVPINNRVDTGLYALVAPLLFISACRWKDTIHDFFIYRQADILDSDMLPHLRGEWKRAKGTAYGRN